MPCGLNGRTRCKYVDTIAKVANDRNDRPIDEVEIISIDVEAGRVAYGDKAEALAAGTVRETRPGEADHADGNEQETHPPLRHDRHNGHGQPCSWQP